MNKTFKVESKSGKQSIVSVRQIPGHDKQYKVGDKIPGLGRVIALAYSNCLKSAG